MLDSLGEGGEQLDTCVKVTPPPAGEAPLPPPLHLPELRLVEMRAGHLRLNLPPTGQLSTLPQKSMSAVTVVCHWLAPVLSSGPGSMTGLD